MPVYHRHHSSRQVRVFQGVEYSSRNRVYFCTTCEVSHQVKMPYGLNVCVSSSELHQLHQPREPGVVCPADKIHVDWLTIPGATISDLSMAWKLDYQHSRRPMRVLLVAGLNDLLKGGNFESVKKELRRFEEEIVHQNRYHPDQPNELTIATMLNPPKMVWFTDNGPPPPGHRDRGEEINLINDWIDAINSLHGKQCAPRFHTWATRTTTREVDGVVREFKTHRWNEWRATETREDKLHLSDKMRVKMGRQVIKYFEGEYERNGPIGII